LIFGAVGLVFGAIGFWRGRRMDRRLQGMESLLADLARTEPGEVVRRVAEAEDLPERPGMDWREVDRRLAALPERERALLTARALGASKPNLAKAFGIPPLKLTQIFDDAVRRTIQATLQPPPDAGAKGRPTEEP
jgi:hypothetical protein